MLALLGLHRAGFAAWLLVALADIIQNRIMVSSLTSQEIYPYSGSLRRARLLAQPSRPGQVRAEGRVRRLLAE